MDTILIFTGGDKPADDIVSDLPQPDLVVAADGGYDIALDLGFRVDVLVGDLDSIKTDRLPDHVIVERHSPDKDQTDLQLALELAQREEPGRVVVVGGSGGRHDHELATAQLLGSDLWAGIDELDWISKRSRGYVVTGARRIHGDVGATVSLIPINGGVDGVTTHGLKWDLHDERLDAGSTRGVSNLLTRPIAEIQVGSGSLLVVIPNDQP